MLLLNLINHERFSEWKLSIFTLSSDQNYWNLGTVAKMSHFRIIVVHRIEAGLIFQTKYEDNGIDPSRKLNE